MIILFQVKALCVVNIKHDKSSSNCLSLVACFPLQKSNIEDKPLEMHQLVFYGCSQTLTNGKRKIQGTIIRKTIVFVSTINQKNTFLVPS